MVTGTPAWAISVPSNTAAVDLPAPPFGETITTVGITKQSDCLNNLVVLETWLYHKPDYKDNLVTSGQDVMLTHTASIC